MKNRWKPIFILMLVMALCLSLAACGKADDVAGDDWRTTGVVAASGTITHDGESVDVLVTVGESSAAFYRDLPEQVLFDSVAFPETIEDISSSAFQISFDDQNGDGESDVLVEIGHEDMSNTTMLWLWDPQERYVYQPEYSSFHVPGVAEPEELIAPYVGLWEYQGKNLWLRVHEDATWEFVNDQDEVIEYGTLWVDENGLTLHFDGSGDTLQLDRTVSGDLIDGNGNWSYYQRAPGAEPAEMDCGTFSYSTDETSTYYADSTLYDGVSYRVFEIDEDTLVWGDEGVYYMME